MRIQARLADLVADIDQFGDPAAQVLACGDLVASGCELGVGDGPGAGLAVDAAGEDPARAVAGVVGVGAAAVGLAALAEGGHERAGAQVAEVGELQEELLSTGGKGFGGGGGIGHEARESGSIIRFQTPGMQNHCSAKQYPLKTPIDQPTSMPISESCRTPT